jgi:hypothetical protein
VTSALQIGIGGAAASAAVGLEIVGQLDGDVNRVHVSDGIAYVGMTLALRMLDLSDPDEPKLAATMVFQDGVGDVDVVGKYAYVAARTSGLRIIDVSDPTAPEEAGWIDTPVVAKAVHVVGSHAYVADHSALLVIRTSVSPPPRTVLLPAPAVPSP